MAELSFSPPSTISAIEAAARAGFDLDSAKKIRRALGLPEAPDDEPQFDDEVIEVLEVLKQITAAGVPFEDLLAVSRAYGRAMSRVADAETRVFRKHFVDPLTRSGASTDEIVEELRPQVDALLELLQRPLQYVHRRHLDVALEQLTAESSSEGASDLTVGFVDLVDFSKISDDLAGGDLGEFVERFEARVVEICTEYDVRMVKSIGDAVMFVSPDPVATVRCALTIVQAVDSDEVLPEARAGLDAGELVPLGGDYFGRPANVAARATAFARPGTTLITKALLLRLPDGIADVATIPSQHLKGVGKVKLFKVRSLSDAPEAGRGS
ncbi:MAG: adenylate cyclase regulatory domain-containing protein [Actinomycetota bacterium]